MTKALLRPLACVAVLALGVSAHAQEVGSRVPEEAVDIGASQPGSRVQGDQPQATAPDESASEKQPRSLLERFRAMFSQKEDPDGPINTDRPTFTPANTVVPPGRLQFESGFTYYHQQSSATINDLYDFPELSVRYGLMDRVELRTLWVGPTFDESEVHSRRARRGLGGGSDMEVGIKMYTDSTNNLPNHFMDGGILYRLTPNIQLDFRAGFGLSGRPDDFFTGTGLSFRF